MFYWFFFKNLNVIFVIGEHDFNSGFIKIFYIVWQLHCLAAYLGSLIFLGFNCLKFFFFFLFFALLCY